jgi:SAM-dependent methyltransferase
MSIRDLHQSNRRAWNEGAEAYEGDLPNQIEFLRAGGQNFRYPELPYLENLDQWCHCAIHLQCAGGTDTLSLWNRGAHEVIGIDISDRMIACAQAKSDALRAPARWIQSDIVEAPADLNNSADLVYTGRGALCWLMDLDQWAETVHRLLKPGGRLYVFEGHPFAELWTLEDDTYILDPECGYYFLETPLESKGWPSTYIGDQIPADQESKYERLWRVDQIINAILAANLTLLKFEEHPDLFWNRFPNMPPDQVRRLPQTFSLLAEKPRA